MSALTRQPGTEPIARFLRRGREIGPQTRVGEAAELLRLSPHRLLAATERGRLVGLLTERALADALLAAASEQERIALRQTSVESLLASPTGVAHPLWSVETLLAALDAHEVEALPVGEADGAFLGLIGRSDFLEELLRPVVPPLIGGMATPRGVYLTTGAASGGASGGALVMTGMLIFGVQIGLLTALGGLSAWVQDALPGVAHLSASLPGGMRQALFSVGGAALYGALFLSVVRLSPLAGYHAAEHQVVHALERSEPLLVESVRLMPREHPRCGTNFIAAALLLSLGGALAPAIGSPGYLLSGLLALIYWRALGGWLQRHFTTRPASVAQLESGIAAAREVLARHSRSATGALSPLSRLRRSGLLHVLGGFLLGALLLAGLALLIPPLGGLLAPHWRALWLH
jgi:CBS domain-containing protein